MSMASTHWVIFFIHIVGVGRKDASIARAFIKKITLNIAKIVNWSICVCIGYGGNGVNNSDSFPITMVR